MTNIDQRHRGRAIRRSRRRNGPTTGVAFVSIAADFRAFERSLHDVMRIFERFGATYGRRPQIIHNGRKPR